MRKALVLTSLVAVFAAVSLSPAAAQANPKVVARQKILKPKLLKQTGTIISVDTAANTFTCKWQMNNWAYKVNDKTVFRTKGKTASFADLKLDSRVSMTFHMDGKQRVADIVTIEQ
jgi:hypothetical protein